DLLGRRAALRERRAARDAAVAELEAARRVAPVLPLLAEVGRLQTELEQARVTVAESHRQLAGALQATGTDNVPLALDGIGRSSAIARAEVGGLRLLAEQEAEADRLLRDTDQLERSVVALEAQAAAVVDWLDEADRRREALIAARERARDARAALPATRAEHQQALDRVAAAVGRDRAGADAVEARDELRRCTDAAQAAHAVWLSLRQDRLDGMAAELAAGLRPGAECPVCGNHDHPSPAAGTGRGVSRDQEERAGAAAADAETARSIAMSELSALEVQVAGLRAAAGGDTPVADLRASAAGAGVRLAAVETAAAAAPGAEEALAAFDEEREARVREQVRLAQQRQEVKDRVLDQQDRLGRLRAVLDEARGDDPSIAARAARLDRLADDCERLAREAGELDRLGTAVAEALARAEEVARERSLGPLESVATAVRNDDDVARLDDLRRRHDTEVSTVEERLADPELADPMVSAPPGAASDDLVALAEVVAVAEQAHADAIGGLTAARARAAALDRLRATLRSVLA
ncbi:MAG: hypothetical protein ACRDV1_16480, partial [Actinomycetes bacterium]